MSGKLVTYDPRFKVSQDRLFKDWNKNRRDWRQRYSDWLTDFNESTAEVEANAQRDKDLLRWQQDFFGGEGLARKNEVFRAKERAADETERLMAQDFADNSANFARVAGGGSALGASSADYARRSRLGSRLGASFAGRDVARERADFATETNAKVGVAGVGRQINTIIEQLSNRQLQPQQLSDAELAASIATLNAIGSGTQFGADKVFWNKPNAWDKVGGTFALVGNGIQDYYSGGQTNTGPGPVAAPNTQSTGGGQAYQMPQQGGYGYPNYVQQNPTGGYSNYAGVSYGGGNAPSYYTGPGGYQGTNYSVSYGNAPTSGSPSAGWEQFSGYGAGVSL